MVPGAGELRRQFDGALEVRDRTRRVAPGKALFGFLILAVGARGNGQLGGGDQGFAAQTVALFELAVAQLDRQIDAPGGAGLAGAHFDGAAHLAASGNECSQGVSAGQQAAETEAPFVIGQGGVLERRGGAVEPDGSARGGKQAAAQFVARRLGMRAEDGDQH